MDHGDHHQQPSSGNNGQIIDQQHTEKPMSCNERRRLIREQLAAASSFVTSSGYESKTPSSNLSSFRGHPSLISDTVSAVSAKSGCGLLFRDLGLPYLFQGFLPSQIQHVAQHLKPMSLWRSPELAMQGGMVNGVSALSCRDDQSQLGSTIGSFEFGEFIRAEDLSRIFDEAFKNETLD
ncbi:hypothetical protein BGX23_003604 [Mortierella sp. AD031]|nr:hypothetical protein BGX23_003604 [Mortierella sp. AD031]